MKLVKHVERGYGHAVQRSDGRWCVYFFEKYDIACHFSETPHPKILTFLTDEVDYDWWKI